MNQKTEKSGNIEELFRQIGRAEALNYMEGLGRITRIEVLKKIRDRRLYRGIPGCQTMRDVFEKIGVSKTTGYRELEALDRLGEDVVELLCEMGLSSRQMALLGAGVPEEEADFEVIDAQLGQVKIEGKIVSVRDSPEVVSAAIRRMLDEFRLTRSANRGLETELAETKNTLKKRDERIKNGEEELRQLKKQIEQPAGNEKIETDLALAITRMLMSMDAVAQAPVEESDKKYASNYLQALDYVEEKVRQKLCPYLPKSEDDI